MIIKTANRAIFAGLAALLAACSVTPEYIKPQSAADRDAESPVGDNFYHAKGIWTQASPADAAPKGEWWKLYADADLDSLLAACKENNPDLVAAYRTVEMAMAKARVTEADLYPHASLDASYARTGTSKNAANYNGTYDNWVSGFGMTWDLDFFGRVRSLMSSDVAEAQAVYAAYQNTLLLLQAQVASSYFTLRQYNSEIALLEETAKVRTSQVEYVSNRLKSGVATDVDLKRAEQLLYEAQSQLEGVKRSKAVAADYMALLVGSTRAKVEPTSLVISDNPPEVPHAVPSELLQRRPDIAQAERQVFAANARIGAARAAYFPTVALTASADLNSSEIDSLFEANSLAWGVSPKVYMPIFQGGRLIASEEYALADHKRLVEQYRSKVLKAMSEVEDALAQIQYLKSEYVFRNRATISAQEVFVLTRKQYDSGIVDYFEVTDSQRITLTNQREQIRLKGDQFRATVQFIAALGGGWYETPDFAASDARNEAEKTLAAPSKIFSEPNPNTPDFGKIDNKN